MRILTLLCSLALLAGSLTPQHAAGQTLTIGQPFNAGTLACDTEEQLDDILTAQTFSYWEGMETLKLYFLTSNEYGNPTCAFGFFKNLVPLERVAMYENVYINNQTRMTYYVLRVLHTSSGTEFFVASLLDTVEPSEDV